MQGGKNALMFILLLSHLKFQRIFLSGLLRMNFYLLVCYVYLFLFRYLANESKCRFDYGVCSMLYMDHWEGQEFKTFEPVSWLPIFI
jgi:hypothetical protein